MKKVLFVLLTMVFAFASISYSQERGTKEQLKIKTELKSQDGNKDGAKEQIRTQEQNRIATETKEKAMEKNQIQSRVKDGKSPAVDGQKEQNAVKNSGDEKKLQEKNRERNREKKQDKKELKKELKEQKKEMKENKKMLQDMNKGGKGPNN